MNYKLILPLFLFSVIVAPSCTKSKKTELSIDSHYIDDPYGLVEAEETGEVTDRLIACSKNDACPENAQALFWVAADLLSKAGAKATEIDAQDFGLTEDMSIDEMTNKIGPQLDAILDDNLHEYDFDSREFKKAHAMMKRAHEAGSIYASNELGLLHMEHLPIRNYDLARTFFEASWKMRDPNGAYNLARLTRLETPLNDRKIITHLKDAASGNMRDFEVLYMLSLEAFGTEHEKQRAKRYLRENKVGKYGLRSDFEEHFLIKETKK